MGCRRADRFGFHVHRARRLVVGAVLRGDVLPDLGSNATPGHGEACCGHCGVHLGAGSRILSILPMGFDAFALAHRRHWHPTKMLPGLARHACMVASWPNRVRTISRSLFPDRVSNCLCPSMQAVVYQGYALLLAQILLTGVLFKKGCPQGGGVIILLSFFSLYRLLKMRMKWGGARARSPLPFYVFPCARPRTAPPPQPLPSHSSSSFTTARRAHPTLSAYAHAPLALALAHARTLHSTRRPPPPIS